MTCVTALKHKGVVYMGTDDIYTMQHLTIATPAKRILDLRMDDNSKVLMGIAGAGTAMMGEIVPWWNSLKSQELQNFNITNLCRALRKLFKEGKHWDLYKDEDSPNSLSGHMLVAYKGELWWLDALFAAMPVDLHLSIGSGCHVATGAMEAFLTESSIADPTYIIKSTIRIASRYIAGIGVCREVLST